MTALSDWATAFLTQLGFTPTPTNVAQVSAWARAESGGVGTYNNPLNTTLKEPGSWGVNYNGGYPVQGYATEQQGIVADATALQGNFPGYAAIRADLQSGSASNAQFASDVGSSPWGTSGTLVASILGTSPSVAPSTATFTNAPNPVVGLSPIGGIASSVSGAVAGVANSAVSGVTGAVEQAALDIFKPLKTPFEHLAVRVALVAFGAVAILVGIATMMRSDGSVGQTIQQAAPSSSSGPGPFSGPPPPRASDRIDPMSGGLAPKETRRASELPAAEAVA